jgi:regulator of ribonuclease activity A
MIDLVLRPAGLAGFFSDVLARCLTVFTLFAAPLARITQTNDVPIWAGGGNMKTADLMDDFQDELQSCTLQFRSYGRIEAFYGPCRTVKCRNDNVLVKQLMSTPGNGGVLVIDGAGSLETALMGDLIAELGRTNGWSGVVINGAVRDTVTIGTMDFGVKALGSNPRKSQKDGVGEVDVPVEFGTVCFTPGNWVYCDEDGIVVASRELPVG